MDVEVRAEASTDLRKEKGEAELAPAVRGYAVARPGRSALDLIGRSTANKVTASYRRVGA